MTDSLIHAIVEMQEAEALQKTEQLLAEGIDAMAILDACSTAMQTVGERFEKGEYFLPHLMMAGDMLKQISETVKPHIKDSDSTAENNGKVLMGTVKGDIHDIGKNMVVFLLEAGGYEVNDIGIDQHPEKFVEAIKAYQPNVIGMSGLLTLAFDSMKATIEAIESAGLRGNLKIIIGGAQVSEQVQVYTGADAFGADAVAGVRQIKQWLEG
jgi:5-methyltetrahydrofolate--homocysteine methyltransferase